MAFQKRIDTIKYYAPIIATNFPDSVKTLALQFKLKVGNFTERTLVEQIHILLRHIFGRNETLDSFGIATFGAKSALYSQLVNTATWSHWLKEKVFSRLLGFGAYYFWWLISTEAVTLKCSVKKVFLKSSPNSQENTYAGVFFSVKLQARSATLSTLLKKRLWHRCFPVSFAKSSRTASGSTWLHTFLFHVLCLWMTKVNTYNPHFI